MAGQAASNGIAAAILAVFGSIFLIIAWCVLHPPAWIEEGAVRPDWIATNLSAFIALCGLGFCWAGIVILTKHRGEPSQPWMAERAWVDGRIPGRFGWPSIARRWVMAGIIAYFAAVIIWVFATGYDQAATAPLFWKAFLEVIIPAWAVFLVARTIAATLRTWRYGQSVLVLENGIPRPGGAFSAHIACRVPLQLEPTFVVTLACHEAVTTIITSSSSDGTSTSTRHYERWRDDYDCAGLQGGDDDGGCTIPVRFDLPASARPTVRGGTDTFEWTLSVRSTVPGVAFTDQFEVPVFRNAPEPSGTVRERAVLPASARQALPDRVLVDQDQDHLTVTFPPALERGKALLFTYLAVVGGIISWMCLGAEAWLGLIGCLAVTVLGLHFAAKFWLMSTSVVARSGLITIRTIMPWHHREWQVTVTPETALAVDRQIVNDLAGFRLKLVDGARSRAIGAYLDARSEVLALRDLIATRCGIAVAAEPQTTDGPGTGDAPASVPPQAGDTTSEASTSGTPA